MLGVVVAMEVERRWIPRDAAALVERAGIGAARAEAAALRLLRRGATALASWGTAGGLDPSLLTGTVVVPPMVISTDGHELRCDEAWRQRLLEALDGAVPISRDPLAETEAPLARPAAKHSLHMATGAAAADMESGAVARTAAVHGVPWVAVRAVLDPARWALPAVAITAVAADGRLDPAFAGRLAAVPRMWPAVLRLATAQRRAGRSLRRAWAAAPGLACPRARG